MSVPTQATRCSGLLAEGPVYTHGWWVGTEINGCVKPYRSWIV